MRKSCHKRKNTHLFFEGWSTSVEEFNFYNKTCILSNIPTHLEQKPLKTEFYFNPNNFKELAKVIQKLVPEKIKIIT